MSFPTGARLVVFGCGYVGGAVARRAAARGIEVTAFTRNADTAQRLRADGIATVEGDLASDAWHASMPAADFVLNTVSSAGNGIDGYRHSYLDGMRSLLRWASQHPAPRRALYTSSTAVYPQDGGVVVDETSPTGGSERADVLLAAERAFLEDEGLGDSRLVFRLAGIYGPGRRHLVDQVLTGVVAGSGSHHLNLIHRDDISAAIFAALDETRPLRREVLNLADDGAARKSDIVQWLSQRLGVPPPRFTGQPASGRRTITPDRIISNTRAKQQLGWRPQFADFRAGYENVLAATAD